MSEVLTGAGGASGSAVGGVSVFVVVYSSDMSAAPPSLGIGSSFVSVTVASGSLSCFSNIIELLSSSVLSVYVF